MLYNLYYFQIVLFLIVLFYYFQIVIAENVNSCKISLPNWHCHSYPDSGVVASLRFNVYLQFLQGDFTVLAAEPLIQGMVVF